MYVYCVKGGDTYDGGFNAVYLSFIKPYWREDVYKRQLFVLPTYPTLLGAVQMDDTGSTRIGKLVFNHPFFIPGVLAIAISVALGFLVAPLML